MEMSSVSLSDASALAVAAAADLVSPDRFLREDDEDDRGIILVVLRYFRVMSKWSDPMSE